MRDEHGIIDFISGRLLSLADAAAEVARLNCIWAVLHERIRNEGVGIGRDFFNYLAKHGLKDVVRYVGAGRPREPQRLTNLRSEASWRFRDRLNPDRHTDNQYSNTSRQVPFHVSPRAWWALLREDLEALTYDLVGNQTRLMKKDDLLVRLGRSPDRGDALSQKALRSNQQGVTTVISTLLLTLAMVGSGDPTPQLTSPLPGTGMSTSYPFYCVYLASGHPSRYPLYIYTCYTCICMAIPGLSIPTTTEDSEYGDMGDHGVFLMRLHP